MRIFAFLAGAVLAAMVVATPAFAQQNYSTISLGTLSGNGLICARSGGDCHQGNPDVHYSLDGVQFRGISGEYKTNSLADRGETEFSLVVSESVKNVSGRYLERVDAEVEMVSILGGYYWDFGSGPDIVPYLGFGAGFTWLNGLKGKVRSNGELFSYDRDGTHFVFFAEHGFSVDIGSGREIVTSFRWQDMFDSEYVREDRTALYIFSVGYRLR